MRKLECVDLMLRDHMFIIQQAAKSVEGARLRTRRSIAKSLSWTAICVGLLVACGTVAASEMPSGKEQARKGCKERATRAQAKRAYKKGIIAFEREDWLKAQYYMLKALEFDCDREDLGVIVPYGRWDYSYQPGIYLGLALHRLGQCLKEGGEVCPITRADWNGDWPGFLEEKLGADWKKTMVVDPALQSRCQQARAMSKPPRCCIQEGCLVQLRMSKASYYPAIDWWNKLGSSSANVVLEQTVSDRCGEVSTPLEWLWLGNSLSNDQLCEQLGEELSRLNTTCPAVRGGSP